MPFDSYVISAVAHELNNELEGGKIEKVYQPSATDIIIGVNVPREKKRRVLLLSANSSLPRVYLSKLQSGNPQNPPAFCMLLRKHLIGGRIAGVSAVTSERIIRITADTHSELGVPEKRSLVFELMGKHSNIILLRGDSGVIIDSIKRIYHDMSRVRQVLPGLEYELPPPSTRMPAVTEAEIESGVGLAELNKLDAEHKYEPRIWFGADGFMRDFHVFPLTAYDGFTYESFTAEDAGVSEMLETWYEGKQTGNRIHQKSADMTRVLQTRLSKAQLKKQRLLEDLTKAEKSEEYRKKGDIITANIYMLKRGMDSASLPDYTENAEIKIALDPLLTPAQNAQRYYKKYAKAKTAKIEKRKQLNITEREIEYLESYLVWIADAKTDDDLAELREELSTIGYMKRGKYAARPQANAPKRLRYNLGDGLIVNVGRNNKENDALTTKSAAPYDLWFHTKDIPGSHVVLSREANSDAAKNNPSADPAEIYGADAIRQAAAIAAHYSKARESSNVPVDYTYIRYVKKPAGAKLGMVIFTHNKTIYVDPELGDNSTDA
jgi:predicted ribosome quality control (RQC) complex YloA/Tae2 family protein